MAGSNNDNPERPPTNPRAPASLSAKDLPDHGAIRSLLGYGLRYWSDIMVQVRPDGTVIDRKKYEDAIQRAHKASMTERRTAGM